MIRNVVARAMVLAIVVASVAVATVAQSEDEPFGTPPPAFFPTVKTAIVTNVLSDPKAIEIIKAAGAEAHAEIRGKKKNLWANTLPTRRSTIIGAQDLAEIGNDVVLVTGGNSQVTVGSALLFPNTMFLDIGQPTPCVTQDGRPDPSGTCAGGTRGIPFNYSAVDFAVDQSAYLAGIIAASAASNNVLGIISGRADCDECNAYIEGFTLGAQSVKPGIDIEVAYLSDGDLAAGFADPSAGKSFAEAFIHVFEPDVLFGIAGASTTGMVEAACDAGIFAIGSEIDVSTAYPKLAECILASATEDLDTAVRESIFRVANDNVTKEWILDLAGGGVAVTAEWEQVPGLPVDLPVRYDTALQEIQIGTLDTCPTQCPQRARPEPSPEPSADPGPADEDERTEG